MTEPIVLHVGRIETPIGELLVAVTDEGRLVATYFAPPDDPQALLARAAGSAVRMRAHADPAGCCTALRAYFAGHLDAIETLPAAPVGTPFQREVWSALRMIPCGSTTSYGALARQLGRPAASRAVGLANGANPVSIVIPCHRVIGANGSLTGYGGGLDRKRWLLAHETRGAAPRLF
ncbi:Methylated-DNA--protein-cysteine methyltransferase [Luteitalea pratensis]|uniref:Methylated-DNA--protein-cysteine methyltransferase n=1 Tax=Luteitalea pratensis TaxID=1855912 RepID=A0A143PMS6_LUTPR|nr:methylated-DNA--[protein]-cysteine S-methyltransferase [Luteitalea pratensis]AMY09892.1 Methylated-DNA--protein-cysteine methyltransferase [Luteitalea pratensis]